MSDMLEAALQYGAACKRLVNCKLENANEQITAALFDEIKRLRAELSDAYAEVRKQVAVSKVVFDRALVNRAKASLATPSEEPK